MIAATKNYVEGVMVFRPLKLLTRAALIVMAAIVCAVSGGVSLSGAAVLSADISDSPFMLYSLLFFFLAFGLILWMLRDRRRLKKTLAAAEQENHLQYLQLKSRKSVSLTRDGQGNFSSLDGICRWLGIENDQSGLTCLRGGEGFSEDQFDMLAEDIDRLQTFGTGFRKYFFLRTQKRNIIVKGALLDDDDREKGIIIWFRDATIEENIAAFQDRNTGTIRRRLKFFETTSNLIEFPMWVRDETLKLIWVNKAYVEAVDGDSAEQVIAEGCEMVTSSIGKAAQDIAGHAREINETYSEKHFIVIRGERRAVAIHNIPVQIDNDLTGCIGYAQDITELEQARGELIHHTESHSETLNKLSTAVAIFTSGKRLEYYNSAFSRLWHLPESLLFSHPHHGEVLEAMREARRLPEQANFPAWKASQLAAYTEILEPVEEMWHLPDNSSLRVVTQPHPLGGLLIFYEDVTDHFALERSYNTLNAVQRETLNNLHEGVAVFGIDGCLQLYNEAFAEIWGLDRDRLEANPHAAEVMDICARNYGNSDQITDLKNLIVGGEGKKQLSSGQLKRTGNSVLDYSVVPLPDGATLITFIDVSDSFAIERVLRQRNLALEEADKIKTDFLAHMSYELRTPLNSIIGFSELLEKEYQGPLNDVQHDYMRSILTASGRLLELFNDILDLSVIEAGGLTLDIDSFILTDVVGQVVDQLQDRIRDKKIDLVVKCPEDFKPVQGDARRIQHTLYNLLSNAVKFTPAAGTVTVSVTRDSQNYTVIIQDTGVGIKPDEVDRIFEKFFTGSNVSKEQGAGLGLSLVRNFVDLHGGRIDVQSSLNIGTGITLVLPVSVDAENRVSMAGE